MGGVLCKLSKGLLLWEHVNFGGKEDGLLVGKCQFKMLYSFD